MKRIQILIVVALTTLLLGCNESQNISTAVTDFVSPKSVEASNQNSPVSISQIKKTNGIVFGSKFPEVLAVDISPAQSDKFRFSVTLSSPYDTPERYADAWRVLDDQDKQLGIRVLWHDHANEQPFTRSATISIPANTRTVYVEGRDQANGWSGQRFKVEIP